MIRISRDLVITYCVICAMALLGTPRAYGAGEVVARINSQAITLDRFNKLYLESQASYPFVALTKKEFLEELVKRELGVQEAKRMNLEKDPDVIERVNTVLYQVLLEKKIGKEFERVNVSEKEARDFYSKYPEIRTSHIFIAVKPGSLPKDERAAFDRMKKVQEHLRKSEMGFAEAAQRFSEGPEAAAGGDLDYQTRDRLDPAFYDAALKLRSPGKVSDIVRSRYGYHIIKLTAIRTWEEVDKPKVKRLAIEKRRQDLVDQYVNGLRHAAKISIETKYLQ